MKNIFRIIFWSFILIICITCGILGIMENNKEFESKKDMLNSFIDYFNNSEQINEYKNRNITVKASLNGRSIIVNYEGLSNKKNYKFKCKDNYLEIKYPIDEVFAYTVTMIMADSINQYYGYNAKSTYELFNNKTVFNYNLSQGIKIERLYNDYLVKIVYNSPIQLP